MRKMSFTSRDTARAADILSMAIEDPACSVWLTLAGSTSAGGCMHVYRDMVKFGMIDTVVATGASIVDMDFFEALGFKHYQAQAGPVDDNVTCARTTSTASMTLTSTRKSLQNCDHTILEIANGARAASLFEPRVHPRDRAGGWPRAASPRSPAA